MKETNSDYVRKTIDKNANILSNFNKYIEKR